MLILYFDQLFMDQKLKDGGILMIIINDICKGPNPLEIKAKGTLVKKYNK